MNAVLMLMFCFAHRMTHAQPMPNRRGTACIKFLIVMFWQKKTKPKRI